MSRLPLVGTDLHPISTPPRRGTHTDMVQWEQAQLETGEILMSVYHCPLCPLVFQYRTEVEWHLREEHRSRADEDAELRGELGAAIGPVDWERLRTLRSSEGRPAVTLLLATAPAATMTPLDIARLRQLAERARRRLAAEPNRDTPNSVVEHRLAKAVSTAETLPTERGMAVLVNRHDIAISTLPFAPRDRQIVDDRFATRDLEYALRRHPRYRVLVIGRHPRVLEGRTGSLVEPLTEHSSRTRLAQDDASLKLADPEALFTQRVNAAGRLPLVVIGDHRHLERFRQISDYSTDVIAEVIRPRLKRVSVTDLAARAVDHWLSGNQQLALAELQHADRYDLVAWGVEAAWSALTTRAADRIWVEHDYQVPGRILPGVYGVETTDDPAEPGVIDDLVDAVIAKADHLGVPVDLVDPGTLQHPDRIAARLTLATPGPVTPANAPSLVTT